MSASLMGKVFYTDLPAHLRVTMLAIADVANDDGGSVHIGQRHLGLKTGAGERTVRRSIAELIERGYLVELGRTKQAVKKYRVVIGALPSDVEIEARKAALFADADLAEQPADLAGAEPDETVAEQPADLAGPSADRSPVSAENRSPMSGLDRSPVSAEPSEEPSDQPSVKSLASRSSTRAPDPIFETLAILDGFDYSEHEGRRPNDDERGKINRAARLVRQSVGADADLLRSAIACWPEVMDDALCTARGVSTNIGRLLAAAEGRVFRAGAGEGDIAKLSRELAKPVIP